MDSKYDVAVIGGGGLQAAAMFEAADRAADLSRWLAIDRSWRPDRRQAVEALGVATAVCDVLNDPEGLRDLTGQATIVANFAGPFYLTGGAVLDACIDTGAHYLDICDDADATLDLLARHERVASAGIRALVGMGSSPGVTNVLARAAVEALDRPAPSVDICWVVDVEDVSNAAIEHFWHIFGQVDGDGHRHPVPAWEDLKTKQVEFPAPIGTRTVIELSHPEPITLPRFLNVAQVRNHGGLTPDDALVVCWALARLGADRPGTVSVDGQEATISVAARALYEQYRERRQPAPYLGGGLVIDVHADGDGYRFSSGDRTSMEESTGTPAAAGILLMLSEEDELPPGVSAPECLAPPAFFSSLGRVSRGSGSLKLRRLEAGQPTDSLRIRDLFATPANA